MFGTRAPTSFPAGSHYRRWLGKHCGSCVRQLCPTVVSASCIYQLCPPVVSASCLRGFRHQHLALGPDTSRRHGIAPHCIAPHRTVLHCTTPHFTSVHWYVLQNTVLHRTKLHCTSPHRTALHCLASHFIPQHRSVLCKAAVWKKKLLPSRASILYCAIHCALYSV